MPDCMPDDALHFIPFHIYYAPLIGLYCSVFGLSKICQLFEFSFMKLVTRSAVAIAILCMIHAPTQNWFAIFVKTNFWAVKMKCLLNEFVRCRYRRWLVYTCSAVWVYCHALSGHVELKLETIVWRWGMNTFLLCFVSNFLLENPLTKCQTECLWQRTRTSNNLTILSSSLKCFSIYILMKISFVYLFAILLRTRALSLSLCLCFFANSKS